MIMESATTRTMKNTIENKHKFMALYFGQEVYMFDDTHPVLNKLSFWSMIENEDEDKDYVVLKPLTSITEEDAVEAVKIVFPSWINAQIIYNAGNQIAVAPERPYYGDTFEFYTNTCVLHHDNASTLGYLQAYDYLRSKGYALPFMGLSVEQQLEYGWIKLIQ